MGSESTHNWGSHEWTVPVSAGIKKVLTMGKLPVQPGGAVRYYAESPELGPDGWGGQVSLTLLLRK